MRKSLFLQRLLLSSLVLFLMGGRALATVNWSGVATDVTNDDIVITTDSVIPDSIYVNATLTGTMPHKVTVTLTQDVILTGSGQPILYLTADDGCVIDFRVNHDLTFQGVDDGTPLLIVVRGLGTVIFDMYGGNQVTFTQNGANGGGTRLYVVENLFSGDKGIALIFQRYLCEITSETMLNVFINIGPNSSFGYVASEQIQSIKRSCFSGNERGVIRFDPSNLLSATGRMVLNIANTGAVVVGGRYAANAQADDLTLEDIDTTLPAGCDAVFEVVNTKGENGVGGLMIVNSNSTPFEYLADPWGNLGVRNDTIDYTGSFNGIQYGFVVGAQGVLDIGEYAYVDYVGLALDVCPSGFTIPCEFSVMDLPCPVVNCCTVPEPTALCDIPLNQLIKKRNYSALVVDGYLNPLARPASIQFADHSALFFRSGIDRDGVVEHPITIDPLDELNPFVIDPTKESVCLGNMVFDVEGFLQVVGPEDQGPNKTELLSLEVTFSGAPVLIRGPEVNFPLRTFATDLDGEYLKYNAGYFFYNNCVQMCDTWLVHTDLNHRVYEKDDVNSVPAYIGGETWTIIPDTTRPTLAFINSQLYVMADIAFTGMDLLIPNGLECTCLETCIETPESFIDICPADIWPVRQTLPELFARLSHTLTRHCPTCDFTTPTICIDNSSAFVFFYNGYRIDAGTGRQMVLGTFIGSTACDCCAVINDDAHLDVMQVTEVPESCDPVPTQLLALQTAANDATINNLITGDILNQFENQTIYLGHNSNISIGTHQNPSCPVYNTLTVPTVDIQGDFFSFETRGGQTNTPQNSSITGQGGIFVDQNGVITIEPCIRANMGTMVTKSSNGVINLPSSSVLFDPTLGGATWQLNLAVTQTIVPANNTLSDYTLNWMATIKDPDFIPYIAACVACGPCCLCPAVTVTNMINIPEVDGTIDQLQIKESRLGDPVHLLVNGGWVRELVFLPGCNSAEAPTGVVFVENYGRVGLGSAHRNVDSLDASIKLGLNGVTVVANGNGRVSLNEDVIIDNVCHILRGPDFAEGQKLTIDSDCCHTLRVKKGGILDFSSFDNSAYTIEFTGHINLILEPGAIVYLNGATVQFSEEVTINCEGTDSVIGGSLLTDLDQYRVKFFGTGRVLLSGCSQFIVNNGAFVGVETNPACYDVFATDLTFELQNSAQLLIGEGCNPLGGAFQIGDSADLATTVTPEVSFTLFLNGPDARFLVGPQGFFGAGVGISDKSSSIPNEWLVDATWNVKAVNLLVIDGIFQHDQIYTGADAQAALLAVGPARQHDTAMTATFTLDFTPIPNPDTTNVSRSAIRGGGNFALITPDESQADAAINPIILDIAGTTSGSRITAGIVASKPLFRADTFVSGDASDLFNFWATGDVAGSLTQYANRADVGAGLRNTMRLGYVDGGFIARRDRVIIVGQGGTATTQAYSINIGAAAIQLIAGTAPRNLGTVWSLS